MSYINSLHALKKEWPVYPRLLELAMKLKGTEMVVSEKKNKGIFESLTTAVTDMFQTYTEPKPAPKPYKQQPAQNEFYYDKAKGIWVINGKEADAEYDMGQEPVSRTAKIEEVEPPPIANMSMPKMNIGEVEEDVTPEVFSGAFGKVTVSHSKKKGGHKNLYVSHN